MIRRGDSIDAILDDEADPDRCDDRRHGSSALQAGEHEHLEHDPDQDEDEERGDRAPNDRQPGVQVDEQGHVGAQRHQVAIGEVGESADAVDQR